MDDKTSESAIKLLENLLKFYELVVITVQDDEQLYSKCTANVHILREAIHKIKHGKDPKKIISKAIHLLH